MKEIFHERKKECDANCVSYLLACLLFVSPVLLLFQAMVRTCTNPSAPGWKPLS